MCVVSMIGDHYRDKWEDHWPNRFPSIPDIHSVTSPVFVQTVSRQEFEDLKREVTEMKELLKRAKMYDEQNDEPDCEMEDKVALLRKVADLVGVSLGDVLGRP